MSSAVNFRRTEEKEHRISSENIIKSMSCSGCRVLRKGCSDNCILRQGLQWIESAESQAAATLFVAKFFGRAGLMSFLESVSEPQRPDLFKSLLYEACGRTINPVNGAVGLLWTGKWDKCQAAVQTVLSGQNLSRHSAPADDNMDLPGVYNIPVSIRRVRQKTLHENERALCNADSDAADLRLSMPGPKCVSTTANMKKQRISSSVDNASRFSCDESAEKTLEDQEKYHNCLHKSLHMQPEQ